VPLHHSNDSRYFERSADAIALIDPGYRSIALIQALSLVHLLFVGGRDSTIVDLSYHLRHSDNRLPMPLFNKVGAGITCPILKLK